MIARLCAILGHASTVFVAILRFALLSFSLSSFSLSSFAQVQSTEPTPANTLSKTVVDAASPIQALGSEYQNSIELLRNRFRIDDNIDDITMVFFREYGSAPVVLVRPDGSKLFQYQADGEDVAWYDSETYDMIQIKHPVAGPWQAVGQITPNSRIMVLSDIELHAQSLPPIIFSGEILKQTAKLTNGNQPIDYGPFRDVVELSIELVSTNNADFDNFGAQTQEVARYEDNGRGMDEHALDGEFTGQFNLAVAPGEWTPIFRVTTPMYTREQVDPPIRLFPTPIIISEILNGGGENYHKIVIDSVRDLVDINSLLVDGKIRFPNGDIQHFSITELTDQPREHLIVAYEDGVFRVKITAYGKTVNGRDFILNVPEYSFLVKTSKPKVPEAADAEMDDEGAQTKVQSKAQQDSSTTPQSTNIDDEITDIVQPEPSFPWALVIWINAIILILGIIGIVVVLIIRNGLPDWFAKRDKVLKKSAKTKQDD